MHKLNTARRGFTLIEMAIVLVIIGLIIGGVLVGQNLIKAASVRATISQIEKYNTAVNTFRGKYGELPGDMDNTAATQFGFLSRPTGSGYGDNNGLLESWQGAAPHGMHTAGEPLMFWVDLSTAGLIDQSFTAATPTSWSTINATSTPSTSSYYPSAKLGGGNYIFTFSMGGFNYYGLANITDATVWMDTTWASLTIGQALSIDTKIDDGLAMTGNVLAGYVDNSTFNQTGASGTVTGCNNYGPVYLIDTYGENSLTCALNFRFQAGD